MSLSDKLKRGDINIKKKSHHRGGNLSPMSQNYKKYLQGGVVNDKLDSKKDDIYKKVNIKRTKTKKEISDSKEYDIKIIHNKHKEKKHKFTRKKPSKIKVKDINEIEKQIEQSKKNSNSYIFKDYRLLILISNFYYFY